MSSIAITGVGLELPGLASLADLWRDEPFVRDPDAFRPEVLLGKKGLFGKDRATRLALCAARKTLDDAKCAGSHEDTGVIVSCSLGNLDTVCKAAETIAAGHVRDLSPMDLPNASSNIVASSLALRFQCRALNVSLCGGSESGIHALWLACTALGAHRAKRILAIGVEARTSASNALLTQSLRRWLGTDAHCPMLEGAAGLLLEPREVALARGAPIYATIATGPLRQSRDLDEAGLAMLGRSGLPDLWLTPNCGHGPIESQVERAAQRWSFPRERRFDVGARLGEGYALTGVLQGLAGCVWLKEQGSRLAPRDGFLTRSVRTTLNDHCDAQVVITGGGVCGEPFSGLLLSGPSAS